MRNNPVREYSPSNFKKDVRKNLNEIPRHTILNKRMPYNNYDSLQKTAPRSKSKNAAVNISSSTVANNQRDESSISNSMLVDSDKNKRINRGPSIRGVDRSFDVDSKRGSRKKAASKQLNTSVPEIRVYGPEKGNKENEFQMQRTKGFNPNLAKPGAYADSSRRPYLNNVEEEKNLNRRNIDKDNSLVQSENDKKVKIKTFLEIDKRALSAFEKGKLHFDEGKLEDALSCFKEALSIETDHIDSKYYIGVCLVSLDRPEEAIQELLAVLEKEQSTRFNAYLLLAVSYKKLGKIEEAIKQLDLALSRHQQFFDAYIYRGKLLVKISEFDKALSDFENAIKICPERVIAHLGRADCLRFKKNFIEAIEIYTEMISQKEINHSSILLKRALTYMECDKFESAAIDLDQLLEKDDSDSEFHFFKGMLFYKQKNFNEALLCFEQAIKHNSSHQAVLKSIFEIAKIKIEQRDFYAALYTLNRYDNLDFQLHKGSFLKFKTFTEAAIHLMKRKFREGVRNLTNLKREIRLSSFLQPLVLNYRAYGYFCLGDYETALKDYEALEKIVGKLEKSSTYNKIICQGILQAEAHHLERASKIFKAASALFPSKMEPLFYQSILILKKFLRKQKNVYSRKSDLRHCLNQLEVCLEKNDTIPGVHFARGVLFLALDYKNEAIACLEKAIEKSDEVPPNYYYVRGMAYASSRCLKQAINDFSTVLKIKIDFPEVLLERANCYQMMGEEQNAAQDLRIFISQKPTNSTVHIWAGHLLFNKGLFLEAVRAYSNTNHILYNESVLLWRAKSYVVLRELNLALDDLKRIYELSRDKKNLFDRDCLRALKFASSSPTEHSESTEEDGDQLLPFKKGILLLKNLNAPKLEGDIFKRHDFYLYKGIFLFYCQKYKSAAENFHMAHKERLRIKTDFLEDDEEVNELSRLMNLDSEELEMDLKKEKQDGDLNFDCSFNTAEYYYNSMLCHIMLRDFEKAHEFCLSLKSALPENWSQRKHLHLLLEFIRYELNLLEIDEYHLETLQSIKSISIFPTMDRLCSIFPHVNLNFSANKNLKVQLSFCLPKIEFPEVNIKIEDNILELLGFSTVEGKPEAPWIRRLEEGVIFTDNIQYFEDLNLKTESKQESSQDKKSNTPYETSEVDEFGSEHGEEDENPVLIEDNSPLIEEWQDKNIGKKRVEYIPPEDESKLMIKNSEDLIVIKKETKEEKDKSKAIEKLKLPDHVNKEPWKRK